MRCCYLFLNWSIPRDMHNKIHEKFSIIFILLFGKIYVRRPEAQGRGFHRDIPLKTINSGQSEIKICLMWVETVASFHQIQLRHFILYWWQAKQNNYYWIIGFGYYISVFWSVQPIPVHRYQPIGRTNLYGNLSPRRCCVDESVAWKFNIIYIYIFGQA